MVDQVDERRVVYMRLSEIVPAPRNAKRHAADKIERSLSRFGIADLPVLDERTERLVSGHGRVERLRSMQSAGRPAPRGVDVEPESGEWRVPVLRGWASETDADAEAYLVAANATTLAGDWDEDELAMMMRSLADIDADLLDVVGFDDDRIEELLASLEPEVVHTDIPKTQATYNETPAEEAAREERIAGYEPRAGAQTGFTEMILVYTNEDRDEAGRLIAATRESLGGDMRASEVVLRALRTLVAVLDSRHDPTPVYCGRLAAHAGWTADP